MNYLKESLIVHASLVIAWSVVAPLIKADPWLETLIWGLVMILCLVV